jgi:SAM-dependent methyltransferase
MFLNPRIAGSQRGYSQEFVDSYIDLLIKFGVLRSDRSADEAVIPNYYPEIVDLTHTVYDGTSVLDIGCGIGMSILALKVKGIQAKGIDIDPFMVATGRRLFGLDLEVRNLVDVDGRYSVATLSSVLEHVHEPVAFLDAIRTHILTESGHLVLTVPNILDISYIENGTAEDHRYHRGHVWYFNETTLSIVAERAGYRVERMYRHDIVLPGTIGNAMRFIRKYLCVDANLYGGIGCVLKAC